MNNRGFTLVELIIAIIIITIISVGFLGWATTIIQSNLSIEKNNTAYSIAIDVADRLQRMSDNALIQPRSGNAKYVGFDDNTDKDGDGQTYDLNGCNGSNPSVNITSTTTGMTTYTNPFGNNLLYLYDNNACDSKTWVDTGCGSGIAAITTGGGGANANIDHPNALGSDLTDSYDSINPIRSYRNTTYYAVWSVAYMPCNASDTNRRKIFITVYWIDPEPTDTVAANVVGKINSGAYALKSVSIVIDKTIGAEG